MVGEEVLLEYCTKKSEYIGADCNPYDALNIFSKDYMFKPFQQRAYPNSSTFFSNNLNFLVNSVPIVNENPSIPTTQASGQVCSYPQQFRKVAVNGHVPIIPQQYVSVSCPTSSAAIFSHNETIPNYWSFNFIGNSGVSSEHLHSNYLIENQSNPLLPAHQSFNYGAFNHINSNNLSVYSHDKVLTNRETSLASENILHEPLNLSKFSGKVWNKSTAADINDRVLNSRANTDFSNSIMNKEFNVSEILNPFNVHLQNCNIAVTFPLSSDKYALPLDGNMNEIPENRESNSISQEENRSVSQHAQCINETENIDQNSLSIEKNLKHEKDKTINKSGSFLRKRINLKERKRQFHKELNENRLQEFNHVNAHTESECCLQLGPPQSNMSSPLYLTELKSLKGTQLFKDCSINSISSDMVTHVEIIRPDVSVGAKSLKVVLNKRSSSLVKKNTKASQKSTRKAIPGGKVKKPKSENNKVTCNILKQNTHSSNTFDVKNLLSQRGRMGRLSNRTNLNAPEIIPQNFSSAGITFSAGNTSNINISAKKDGSSDYVKQCRNKNLNETLNTQKESRNKTHKNPISKFKIISTNKAYKSSTKYKNNRTMIFRQVKEVLQNVSTAACQRNQVEFKNNYDTDSCITANNLESSCNCNISGGPFDLINDHKVSSNCKHVVGNVPPCATSQLTDTITNDTSENYSFGKLHKADNSRSKFLDGDELKLTDTGLLTVCAKNIISHDPVYPLVGKTVSSIGSCPVLSQTNKTADSHAESNLIIASSFSLSGFWDSISCEVPYIENNCWKLCDQV